MSKKKPNANPAAQSLRALRTNYDATKLGGRPQTRTCTCSRTDGTHSSKCPIYKREQEAKSRARKKAQQQQQEVVEVGEKKETNEA